MDTRKIIRDSSGSKVYEIVRTGDGLWIFDYVGQKVSKRTVKGRCRKVVSLKNWAKRKRRGVIL